MDFSSAATSSWKNMLSINAVVVEEKQRRRKNLPSMSHKLFK